MNIFQEIKERVTAKDVAKAYGLTVSKNNMANCPFHDDRHPSMKIDRGYFCFACGAKGDAIGYVAQRYGLSQYDAAQKIIHDLHLPISTDRHYPRRQSKETYQWQKMMAQQEKLLRTKERFRKWKLTQIDKLHRIRSDIDRIKTYYQNAPPETVFASPEYAEAVHAEPIIEYWLDILCLGTEEEQQQFFLENRKGVNAYGERITSCLARIVAEDRQHHG